MKTNKIIIFSLAVCLIITITMIFIPKSVFALKGTVTTDGVRIRKEPSTDSEILTDVYKTDKIEVIEKSGDWYKVTFGEYTGYMSGAYVNVDGQLPVATNTDKVEDNKEDKEEPKALTEPETDESKDITEVKVYMLPLLYSNVIDTITIDSNAEVVKTLNNWAHVKYGDKEGWVVKGNFDRLTKQEEGSSDEQATNNETDTDTPEASNTEKIAYINVSSAVVRSQASLEGDPIVGLSRNTEVTIVEEGTEWTKIKTNSVEGYVATRLLSDEATETTSRSLNEERKLVITPYYVNTATANIRSEANTDSEKIGYVSRKDEVSVVGEEDDFYRIKYNDGYAYIAKKLVVDDIEKVVVPVVQTYSSSSRSSSSSESASANPAASGSPSGIVSYAMQFVGYSYVYGGSSPSGFDCSGFVYYVLNNCGYSAGRTISSQMSQSSYVSRDNLQPGDILVFNDYSNSSIGHTGIYIGGGQMVHAANSSRGVTIDSITSGYYDVRYVTARRF